ALGAVTRLQWPSNGDRDAMNSIRTIGVTGSGTMGNGIAHVAARSGYAVILHDIAHPALDRALSTISQNLDREVAKNKISAADTSAAIARIQPTTESNALAAADFIIEAVTEDVETKSRLFETLDAVARPGVILASNTSSISITRIASRTHRPDRVIGMHF